MSELKLKGTIKEILKVETGKTKAGKEWKKQNFVIDTNDEYNPDVCFTLFGDNKIEMLKEYTKGSEVEVSFNLSSREFNGKYYHNVDAWRITSVQGATKPKVVVESESDDNLDLPF